ncbi:MAG: acylphosphatase [Gammaproteobacteria bacterium]|nr:acylphosphatase [Gammaproteobacteria bacterium]
MTCRRYLVTGRVQGVAFRHSTVVVARELGLTGWCRNLADGSVEVCACGDEAALSQLNAPAPPGPAGGAGGSSGKRAGGDGTPGRIRDSS